MRTAREERAIALALSDLLGSGRKLSGYNEWLEWTAHTHSFLAKATDDVTASEFALKSKRLTRFSDWETRRAAQLGFLEALSIAHSAATADHAPELDSGGHSANASLVPSPGLLSAPPVGLFSAAASAQRTGDQAKDKCGRRPCLHRCVAHRRAPLLVGPDSSNDSPASPRLHRICRRYSGGPLSSDSPTTRRADPCATGFRKIQVNRFFATDRTCALRCA